MSARFNAVEVFEMAERMEINGGRYYRRAAEGIASPRARELLLHLAAMEDEHRNIFAAMKADFAQEKEATTIFDPQGEASLYLQAMVDGVVFDAQADPTEDLTPDTTVQDIIQTAIGLEKDTIIFYLGMKEMVPEEMGKDKIDAIIREEMTHITILSKELASQN